MRSVGVASGDVGKKLENIWSSATLDVVACNVVAGYGIGIDGARDLELDPDYSYIQIT